MIKGTNRMDFEEFINTLVSGVESRVNQEASVMVMNIQRPNNNSAPALVFRPLDPNRTMSPVIYLRSLYDDYVDGKSMSILISDSIRRFKSNCDAFDYDINTFIDFTKVKDQIVFRLINQSKNKRLLEDIPYTLYHGLAVVYYCQIDSSHSILIRNSHVTMWKIDNDTLHSLALTNTRRMYPPQIMTINQVLSELPGVPSIMSSQDNEMYIVTNVKMMYGAACVLYDDVLSDACRKAGCDKVYILPSSIHEMILIPATAADGSTKIEPDVLLQIVSEINKKYVSVEDFLATAVYSYDLQKKQFIVVA
ncbi:MAG: DUF5688 family protein [Lachnospiraceae bacterium]|nr:DUF5688 family protein [Lachnospiraceae bacterium]